MLLPPVYFVIRRNRREQAKEGWLQAMTDADFEALAQFSNKAAAWVMVGFGGLMIAFKETFELVEGSDWPTVLFWILAVPMLAVSVAFGLSRVRWMDRQMAVRRANSG